MKAEWWLVLVITTASVGCWAMSGGQREGMGDAMQCMSPDKVELGGLLGYRFKVNELNRLLPMSEETLLSGFRQRPGGQAWIGEHVGKWLHAAVLTWVNTGNPELKRKIDGVVRKLIATQEPDGYLGTYDQPTRWSMEKERGWDVWVHKYVLIGLLTYYQWAKIMGSKDGGELAESALVAACKAADLILKTFGTGEGQLDLMERSTHVGMASSSILQPMVWLYRLTGDKRYLNFCRYIVWAWEHSPHGPRLLGSLLTHGDVYKTANGKAYEMMSCLVGALELYRALRDEGKGEEGEALLLAAERAWDDIVTNHLYITGGTSFGEYFQPDHHLPNSGAVSETCATVTLLQLTIELFKLTGEARYMDIAERIIFNHLLAAQHPNGDRWCYFTPLEGRKEYRSDVNCCASSGPRGIALVPTFSYTRDEMGGICVNLYSKSRLRLKEEGIEIEQDTDYPYDGIVTLRLHLSQPKSFVLRLRIPEWCEGAMVEVNGEVKRQVGKGYYELRRQWRNGDVVRLEFPIKLKIVNGTYTNEGKWALMWGPLILAVDERFLREEVTELTDVTIAPADSEGLPVEIVEVEKAGALWEGEKIFETEGTLLSDPQRRLKLLLTDFAHAGAKGTNFTVWLTRNRG